MTYITTPCLSARYLRLSETYNRVFQPPNTAQIESIVPTVKIANFCAGLSGVHLCKAVKNIQPMLQRLTVSNLKPNPFLNL